MRVVDEDNLRAHCNETERCFLDDCKFFVVGLACGVGSKEHE